jgi:hypothetical protein
MCGCSGPLLVAACHVTSSCMRNGATPQAVVQTLETGQCGCCGAPKITQIHLICCNKSFQAFGRIQVSCAYAPFVIPYGIRMYVLRSILYGIRLYMLQIYAFPHPYACLHAEGVRFVCQRCRGAVLRLPHPMFMHHTCQRVCF